MLYRIVDRLFLGTERRNVQLSRSLSQIPYYPGRKGGTHSVSDWAYTIGLFHAVLNYTLGDREKVDHFDVGCGTGRLSLASKLLIGENGSYTGIDVNEGDVNFCKSHYDDPRAKFVHLPHKNRAYAKEQGDTFAPYPFADASFDVVTALSVWTHLNEPDATFYMKEVARVMRPGAKAIITFFILDEAYDAFMKSNPQEQSGYTFRRPAKWKFDTAVDGSDAWFCPSWATVPEWATGVTSEGMRRLEEASGLKIIETHHGYWHERPGLFFQDVVVWEKPAA